LHQDAAPSQPEASSSKPKPPVSKFANYSTAASLGYKDEDAERAAMIAEQRSKEGTVGAWEVVVPPPPPLPSAENSTRSVGGNLEAQVDVKPLQPAAPAYFDEDDTRTFKVTQKKSSFMVGKGLGTLYDPGEIIVKKKQKVEEPASESPPNEGEKLSAPIVTEPEAGGGKGGWQTLDEQVNPTVVLPQHLEPRRGLATVSLPEAPSKETEQSHTAQNAAQPEVQIDSKDTVQATLAPTELNPEQPAETGGGSLFRPRKIKRPINSGSSRRGGRF
jgi:hypothetical protein